MSVVQEVIDELCRNGTRAAHEVSADQDLLSSGLLDSLGLVSMVSWIEDTYGVAIDVMDIVMENFETPNAIAELIRELSAPET